MADFGQSRTSNRGFASMDEKRQREIASKGGQVSGGNFKNDRRRAAEAGRKGGQNVPPSERSFSRDHGLAAKAGRKGGEHGRDSTGVSVSPSVQPIGSGHESSRQKGTPDSQADLSRRDRRPAETSQRAPRDLEHQAATAEVVILAEQEGGDHDDQ